MRVLLVVAAALLIAASPAAAQGYADADYLRVMDRITERLEPTWNERRGVYGTPEWETTIGNAAMLTVFATAAAEGHTGPSRNDARARRLVTLLTTTPFFTAAAPPQPDKMFHTPGWTENLAGPYLAMDKSVDPKVAEALALAVRARGPLGLDDATVATIAGQVDAVARTPFFRFPNVRLNQINWNAELYAYASELTQDPELLRDDYRKHLQAFTRGMATPQLPGGSPNVGPSYRFTYQSNRRASLARNLDSPEYASMTLHVLGWYAQARRAGMAPLPAADLRRLRAWTQRVLFGYWTHAGFLNWDTGWSYGRWMKGKTWAYAQQGLLAIATSPDFATGRERAWAKRLFDQGLTLYAHLGETTGSPWLPSGELFGIVSDEATPTPMFAARTAANAARAVSLGLGDAPAAPPPPFYAYDADIGRLAVSTPRYSTAVLAVSRGIVPYGGLELARLHDGTGDPIGGTGGRAPLAFGVSLTREGRDVLETQSGLREDPRRPPLELTRSPRGRVTRQRVLPDRPDAGPFGRLAVRGSRAAHGARVTSSYAFGRDAIDARWRIRTARRVTATVRFPTSSAAPAVVDDRTLRLPGYVVRWRGPAARVVRLTAPRQRANPTAGPTVALRFPVRRGQVADVRARIVPVGVG